jgi:hypothetical protein
MRNRLLPALGLLGAVSVCLAHDPLPIQGWQDAVDVKPIGDLTITEGELALEAEFLLGHAASPQATCNPAARTASGSAAGEDSTPVVSPVWGTDYWAYEPLEDCGGVMNEHYIVATRLARQRCERLSLQRGIWPPATPIVTAPASYVDAGHHAQYRFIDGPVRVTCVIKVVDPAMHETAGPP